MPRHVPHSRDNGEIAPEGKVVMKRDANGNLVPVFPARKTVETTEAAERPQTPDDPRASTWRQVPPFGGGV